MDDGFGIFVCHMSTDISSRYVSWVFERFVEEDIRNDNDSNCGEVKNDGWLTTMVRENHILDSIQIKFSTEPKNLNLDSEIYTHRFHSWKGMQQQKKSIKYDYARVIFHRIDVALGVPILIWLYKSLNSWTFFTLFGHSWTAFSMHKNTKAHDVYFFFQCSMETSL